MTRKVRSLSTALALGFAGGALAPVAVYLVISHYSRPAVAQPVHTTPAAAKAARHRPQDKAADLGRHLPSQ
jgi:hypothetical protein